MDLSGGVEDVAGRVGGNVDEQLGLGEGKKAGQEEAGQKEARAQGCISSTLGDDRFQCEYTVGVRLWLVFWFAFRGFMPTFVLV